MKKMMIVSAALLAMHQATWSMEMEDAEKNMVEKNFQVKLLDPDNKSVLMKCWECYCENHDEQAQWCIDCAVNTCILCEERYEKLTKWVSVKAKKE